jgi:hypothetical protein
VTDARTQLRALELAADTTYALIHITDCPVKRTALWQALTETRSKREALECEPCE